MNKALFTVKTKLRKEDYRAFMRISTYKRKPLKLVLLALVNLLLAYSLVAYDLRLKELMVYWLAFNLISLLIIEAKLSYRIKKLVKTDRSHFFDKYYIINFYEDHMNIVDEEGLNFQNISYDDFYEIIDSKNYLIFYVNDLMASLINKKDYDYNSQFNDFIEAKFKDKIKKL